MRQILLQNATAILLQNATEVHHKMRQAFYYKMRQLLQIARILLQNVTFITNCDSTQGLTEFFTDPCSVGNLKLRPKSEPTLATQLLA